MIENEMIAASAFCDSHDIDLSFVTALSRYGLLNTTIINQRVFVSEEQLPELERMVRFHYDMDINLQGIETINHLLMQIREMREEMRLLKDHLGIYEQSE